MEFVGVHFHYIGDETEFSAGIHPVSVDRFRSQLELLQKRYVFVSEKDVVNAIQGTKSFPERACLITFDDSLRCQYELAVPILKEKSIPAIFFVSTSPYETGDALVVHKIHYLLAHLSSDVLLTACENLYREYVGAAVPWDRVGADIHHWYRYDSRDVGRLKYLLNYILPPQLLEQIIATVFRTHAGVDAKVFSDKTYMTADMLRDLQSNPLFAIGLHTHTHQNFATVEAEEIARDIKENYRQLRELLGVEKFYGISYPFGMLTQEDFDAKLAQLLPSLNLLYGFTTQKATNTDFSKPFMFHRWNTNDLPGGKRPLMNWE